MFIHWSLHAIPAGEWKRQYVRTSKHHNGFAMYGSKVSKYNIVDATPFGKDPMKDLSAACAKRNIEFGFYYSQDQDWHEPDGRGNDWDFPKERKPQLYLEDKVLPQVKEILTGHGDLGLIWFDTPGLLSAQQVTELRQQHQRKRIPAGRSQREQRSRPSASGPRGGDGWAVRDQARGWDSAHRRGRPAHQLWAAGRRQIGRGPCAEDHANPQSGVTRGGFIGHAAEAARIPRLQLARSVPR
jgi:hypothetical protein